MVSIFLNIYKGRDGHGAFPLRTVDLTAALAAAVIAAAVWYMYYKQYFIGLTLNDAMDYAGIARNVAEGEGFISQYVTPLGMAHHGVPQPDMWRAPLWPLALAGFQKIFGFIDEASALGTGFFFVFTAPLVFLLARQLFNHVVAAGSVLLYIASPQLLYYSISGMTESMAVFFMVLMFLVLASSPANSRAGDILLGFVTGLFYLARYNALLFLPFVALFRALQGKKTAPVAAARVALVFLLTVSPWLARNTILYGSPLFSLQKYEPAMFTGTYPDYVLYVLMDKINVREFIINNMAQIAEKAAAGWQEFLSMAGGQEFWGTAPVLVVLFVLLFWADSRAAAFKGLVAVLFAAQLAALLVIHFIPRLFLIFTPLFIILGIGSLATVLYFLAGYMGNVGRRKGLKLCLGLAVVLGAGVFGVLNFSGSKPGVAEKTMFPLPIAELSGNTSAGDLVMTNEGHLVSWYGNRYAVKIPYAMDMIPALEKISPVKALFISNRILWHMPEVKNEWKNIYYQHPDKIYNFRLYKVYQDKSVLYIKEP
jgi:4-amino-4-deoxy-L-arabinose transferase-like glycosyltransferase